ncbi:transposase [Streptomyces chartreusis]|uniref:transposase n=1 Tax=Streptomyces chartreusis TaxID=1969 RepID=UPI00382D3C28
MQRQHSGTAGRTENSRIGVLLAGRLVVDARWLTAGCICPGPGRMTARCRRASVDDTIALETKVAMARAMVRRRWPTGEDALAAAADNGHSDEGRVAASLRHRPRPRLARTPPSPLSAPVCIAN